MSALTALFWEPGRAQAALAVDQAIDGDFRAAAASTVEAVGVGVATGVALGELGAAAVDTGAAAISTGSGRNGTAGGPRASKPFTRAGKRNVWQQNEATHGVPTCENCGESAVRPRQSQKGVTPPGNEGHVDHIVPEAKGGDGAPINGQLLCRNCNLKKGDNYP